MIGPLIRSRRRRPRRAPVPPHVGRRARNALVDAFQVLVLPFSGWHRVKLELTTLRLAVRDLPPAFDGYRIAFLTDLHASPIVPRWWLDAAVNRANALAPDLILLGGDFVDDHPRYVALVAAVLAPLRAPDGVLGVLGNHDHYVDAEAVRRALHAAGVTELYNAATHVVRNGARLAVCGVGDLEMDAIDFAAAVRDVRPDEPRIVLSHNPDVFAYWPDDVRCDLMLSGHTHGGQAYLPLLGPPFVPSQFGFRYLKGLYAHGGRRLYVSRGIGASGAPFRWRCPPELTLIELRRSP